MVWLKKLSRICSLNWHIAMAPGRCVLCTMYVHCTSTCSAGAWAGGFFGRGSLPSPATSRATYRGRQASPSLHQAQIPLNIGLLCKIWIIWRPFYDNFGNFHGYYVSFSNTTFSMDPMTRPNWFQHFFLCEKMPNLLGDNFGNLQKRCFNLRGIPWIGTFSGLLFLWGLNPNSVFTDQIRLPPITNCHQSPQASVERKSLIFSSSSSVVEKGWRVGSYHWRRLQLLRGEELMAAAEEASPGHGPKKSRDCR